MNKPKKICKINKDNIFECKGGIYLEPRLQEYLKKNHIIRKIIFKYKFH